MNEGMRLSLPQQAALVFPASNAPFPSVATLYSLLYPRAVGKLSRQPLPSRTFPSVHDPGLIDRRGRLVQIDWSTRKFHFICSHRSKLQQVTRFFPCAPTLGSADISTGIIELRKVNAKSQHESDCHEVGVGIILETRKHECEPVDSSEQHGGEASDT